MRPGSHTGEFVMRILNRDHTGAVLKKHIAELKHELARLRSGKDSSSGLMDNIEEFGDIVRERGRRTARHLVHQAHRVRDRAKENPAATFAIAAGIGFLAALLIRRF
jgi:ElaB/YqjD/DUF883 family membrane-anchored ribosome-binding protein